MRSLDRDSCRCVSSAASNLCRSAVSNASRFRAPGNVMEIGSDGRRVRQVAVAEDGTATKTYGIGPSTRPS